MLMSEGDGAAGLGELSARERAVLQLMAEGRSNRGICQELWLSPKTVESHVRSIFVKLELPCVGETHRRVRAVLAWLEAGRHGEADAQAA